MIISPYINFILILCGGILFGFGLVTVTGLNPMTYGVEPTNYKLWWILTVVGLISVIIGWMTT